MTLLGSPDPTYDDGADPMRDDLSLPIRHLNWAGTIANGSRAKGCLEP
jgi:hypothetical protein